MQRSDDDTWNHARGIGAIATVVTESKSGLAEGRCGQHSTCPVW
jgi:hypothetical protein